MLPSIEVNGDKTIDVAQEDNVLILRGFFVNNGFLVMKVTGNEYGFRMAGHLRATKA